MGIRLSEEYLERLTCPSDALGLAELQSTVQVPRSFDCQLLSYGLPDSIFFFETLNWLSQSVRSGAWTYFESVPEYRAFALAHLMSLMDEAEIAAKYRFCIGNWAIAADMQCIDDWVRDREDSHDAWLCEFVRLHQGEFRALLASAS
ncbi:hypothetical protein C8J98_10760 [Luteibacter sp. OK325]|uniref:hypothetical protein n=1 Tax=Luteibacter sp. OK325 TaxID=2135670 RepID=UPI000D3CCA33|nr:hypothetical protein [Luteibacter sp. OK325]PTR29928.1 hypothetical protein C8J98_10760 [Luteibacter sp. OK325]